MSADRTLRIAIIGAGPAGLATGHELLAQGFRDFTLYEATDAVGGTWHIHTYPGLACDVWAHSYTFSYRPNPDWSASFAEQPEIEAYLQRCADEFGLTPKIRLNTRITRMHWQPEGHWLLESDAGLRFEADVVINAMGNQHTPLWPDVPGMDDFRGERFHATRWNHDVPLEGRRIAVVGSAASAVQIVPELAKVASQLTVLQRTANWIMPRGRVAYSDGRRALFRRFPPFLRGTQWVQRTLMGFVFPAVTLGSRTMDSFEKRVKKFIDASVDDPALREALIPRSRYGCKRGLVSDDFYPTLNRPNVELVPEGLAAVRPEGITTASGREIDCDVIVYCTGYKVQDFDRIEVVGRDGRSLAGEMEKAPEALNGVAAPGFPNHFFAVGPNGLILDVPYFTTVEQNVATIVRLLRAKQAAGAKTIEPKPEATRRYNEWLRSRFPLFSWGHASCSSYYQTASGHVPFLFPGNFKSYKKLQDSLSLDAFEST